MDIFVNGAPIEFKLDSERTFGDVYAGLEKWACDGKKKIWSLAIDEKAYDINSRDEFETLEVDGIKTVRVVVGEINPGDELSARVSYLKNTILEAGDAIDTMVKKYHSGNEQALSETWPKVVAVVQQVMQMFPYFLAIRGEAKDSPVYGKLAGFKDVLEEIGKCIEARDYVSFCDQLSYELKPQLEEWDAYLGEVRKSIITGS